jgi:MFS family permease
LTAAISADRFYVGIFGSVNFAGTAFLGLLVARIGDRWGKIEGILLCVLMHVLTVEAMLFVSNSAFLLLVAFFWGGAITYGALINSAIGAIAPEASRAKWISIPMTASMMAAVVAPYLSGYLYEISPYMPFVISLFAAVPVILLALTKPFKER